MSARLQTLDLMRRLNDNAIEANFDDANTLRRAEIALQRWAELECGGGNDYQSWVIERDEQTGIPYRVIWPNKGAPHRYRIADKERGALKRVADVCKRLNAHFYHQTDPRGAALYVSREKLTDSNYTNGVSCAGGA